MSSESWSRAKNAKRNRDPTTCYSKTLDVLLRKPGRASYMSWQPTTDGPSAIPRCTMCYICRWVQKVDHMCKKMLSGIMPHRVLLKYRGSAIPRHRMCYYVNLDVLVAAHDRRPINHRSLNLRAPRRKRTVDAVDSTRRLSQYHAAAGEASPTQPSRGSSSSSRRHPRRYVRAHNPNFSLFVFRRFALAWFVLHGNINSREGARRLCSYS
jgi:hypothetical protein